MARVTRVCGVGALCVAASLLVAPRAAQAQGAAPSAADRMAAQDAYRHALELFDAGRHADALVDFKRAYALAPAFRILYNIGLCQAALGDSLAAVEAFSGYLRQGGARIEPPRRAQVDAEIARLSKQLAWLTLEVVEPDAELSIDGAVIGKGPLTRELRLNAGRHGVEVRSVDGTLKTQSVTLGAGSEQRLRFEAHGVSSSAASGSPDGASPATAAPVAPHREVPWLAWGVTGALGVSTAITGVVALRAHGDEEDLQAKQGVSRADLLGARDKVKNFALATDVLLACTVVATGVSLYLTLKPTSGDAPSTALLVSPGQLSLRGHF
ncbi:MAG TPA: hypothetical protein VHP33_25815 [Polyangiaceae bacterium]|nr:hypothetical protein [Polyangiaceae bacterium]